MDFIRRADRTSTVGSFVGFGPQINDYRRRRSGRVLAVAVFGMTVAVLVSACDSSDSTGNGGGTGGASGVSGGATVPANGGSNTNGGGNAQGGGTASNPSATGGATGIPTTDGNVVYGEVHTGQYHLGPVDFAETEWTNACSPYPASLYSVTGLGGEFVAGVSNSFAQAGGVCDACIYINTATGRQIVARLITYGVENEPGDIDVSPSVYAALNTEEYPRSMTWQFARCPDTGQLMYQFQTEANEWWTSLWVRNSRVPVTKVEVKSANHSAYVELERGTDGTLTDASGFGAGEFTLRLTGMDGQVITDTLSSFTPGQIVESTKQFE